MRHAALLLLSTLAAGAQEFSTVEGRVLNAATGEPVGKVALTLVRVGAKAVDEDWTGNYAAFSDPAGRFAIRSIEPGKYRLRAKRNGFVSLEYGARGTERPGILLDLEQPRQFKDADLRLTPHGVIAGRVIDADGEPLASVQIQLLRQQYVNGKKVLTTTKNAYTNDLGEYRLAGLTPSKYYLYAENNDGLPPASAVSEEFVPTYYPDAASSAGASPIEVTPGAQVRATDMMLRKAPTAVVKGRVVVELPDTVGAPAVRFGLEIGHNNSRASSYRSLAAKVNAAGAFEIRSLTAGTYTVWAEVSRKGQSYVGVTTVRVSGANMDGVVVTVDGGVSMTGKIRLDGETTTAWRPRSLKLRRGGASFDSTLLGWDFRVADDGTFRIEDLQRERYGIVLENLPEGFYVKSIRLADADVAYSGVDLTAGSAGPVEVLVSPKAGAVFGTVRGAPNATVVLLPKEKERHGFPASYHQAASDENGRFVFKNVVPGDYLVYAWEDVEAGAWLDPDFLKPLESKGTAVSVAESAQVTVEVNLVEGQR